MQLIAILLFILSTICDMHGFDFHDSRLKRQGVYNPSECRVVDKNTLGRCVNIYDCPPILNLVKQSSYNPEAAQYVRNSRCGSQGNLPKVCCSDDIWLVKDTFQPTDTPYRIVRKEPRFNLYEDRLKRQDFDGVSNCRTPNNKEGRCINIKSCPSLVKILREVSRDPEARKFLQSFQCGFVGRDPKVCCSDGFEDETRPTNKPNEPNQPIVDPRPPFTIGEGNEGAPERFPRQCGKSEASINRIVGGRPASLRAWPWVVALGYRSSNARQPISWNCGGALITDRHVISAAHCIAGKRVIMVRLGDLDLNTTDDGANHIDVPIERAFPHPEYNAARHTSDIGMVKLRNPVQFSADIQPICLPFSQRLRTKSVVGFSPFIAGWGALAFKAATFPTRLFEAQVEVKSLEDCNAAYNRLPRNPVIIDEKVICAGGDKKDACQGDSGGPMMLPQDGLFYLYGVVSYGYKCAEPGFPGVYTRVSEFVEWIDSNTN